MLSLLWTPTLKEDTLILIQSCPKSSFMFQISTWRDTFMKWKKLSRLMKTPLNSFLQMILRLQVDTFTQKPFQTLCLLSALLINLANFTFKNQITLIISLKQLKLKCRKEPNSIIFKLSVQFSSTLSNKIFKKLYQSLLINRRRLV